MCPSVNVGHSLLQEMSESWFSVVATMPSQVHVDTSSCLDGEPENASPNVRCAQAKNTDERAGQRWCIGMVGSSVTGTVARGRGGGEEHLGLHCDVPTWGTGRLQ